MDLTEGRHRVIFDFVGVNSAIGICQDSYLIEVIRTTPLQRNDLLNGRKVNMKYVAIERHFPHIGRKVADSNIRHALPDFCLFVRGQPDTDGRAPG